MIEEARARTRDLVDLPDDEGVALEIVRDRPWLAFNSYLGGLRGVRDLLEERHGSPPAGFFRSNS